jgi:hypothetical protein
MIKKSSDWLLAKLDAISKRYIYKGKQQNIDTANRMLDYSHVKKLDRVPSIKRIR